MTKRKKARRARNPEARALTSPLFRQRVVPSGKTYRRKTREGRAASDHTNEE